MMDINKIILFSTINVLLFLTIPSLLSAQSPPAPVSLSPSPSPLGSPTPSPAPSPALHHVNLSDLFTHAGPYHTFLAYLIQTNVIEIFQSQANDTKSGGLTVFAPSDSAFSALKKSTLSNLTNDQLKTLLLYHAFPHYYSLSDFKNLSTQNPVTTYAGGSYTLNLTYDMGVIHVISGWFNAKEISSVYATAPVAIYEIDMVLIPKEMFSVEPVLAPVPSPPPEATPADAPSSSVNGTSPPSSKSDSTTPNSSNGIRVGILECLVLVLAGSLYNVL
ncbi:Fasciclin-like arabinogalactan family protein [Rhynchospora pubera]|uniref:Fasciclin-like arabinogalactan family protein n=1 Tax=Rhynchospora pubera TaxID=906938 RepID=A0AAV8FUB1_9POAL|nr:Fasciclin-like arabinogalactan family protein [Rhynchospora pubera]KAJ4793877.1 Fasciclin-like arabinogalactan family protein [Rhynchospora pubera]